MNKKPKYLLRNKLDDDENKSWRSIKRLTLEAMRETVYAVICYGLLSMLFCN